MAKCGRKCEVYTRIVGYHRPTKHWHRGKKSEFDERKAFNLSPRAAGHFHEPPITRHPK
jgi:ribonucleoside-triphosphate reductase